MKVRMSASPSVKSGKQKNLWKLIRGTREWAILQICLFILILTGIMIAGSRIPLDSIYVDLDRVNLPPGPAHLFGTDWVGRDMLTRTIKGLSLSIWVGIICSLASTLVAVIFGVLGPTLGGKADAVVSWMVDLVLSVPHAILHEASITFLGFGLPPHEPAIGVILSESMKYLTSGQWWLAFFPGVCLIAVSIMVSALGRSIERITNPVTVYKK